MVEKPYLAKSNGMKFRNFGHKQGIQVRKRNPWVDAVPILKGQYTVSTYYL